MTKISNTCMLLAVLVMGSTFISGCSSKHIRKTDMYGLSSGKRVVDETKVAKSFGVSYTAYSREEDFIKRYKAHQAKRGRPTPNHIDIWLQSRKLGILPSEYIPYLLDAEEKMMKQEQRD